MKALEHYKTIRNHKKMVVRGCFKIGLYRQGLMHDLSKLAPTEFLVGAKYYKGTESPNNGERLDKGYSLAWLHHKGRNKHHFEYWIDYDIRPGKGGAMTGMKMPVNYVAEMFVDRVSASRNYGKDDYNDWFAWNYYAQGRGKYIIHEQTKALLELLLAMLAIEGEDYTNRYIRKVVLANPKNRDIYPKLPNYDYKAQVCKEMTPEEIIKKFHNRNNKKKF